MSISTFPIRRSATICLACMRNDALSHTSVLSSALRSRKSTLAPDGFTQHASSAHVSPLLFSARNTGGDNKGPTKEDEANKSPVPETERKEGEALSPDEKRKYTDYPKVDERTLGIGTSIQVLQKHLPALLQSPPPSAILSPSITLHLFPSTHPDLPTVRGRMAYMAALWTAPVAWGRIPGLNVKLEILSERMVGEEFVVRWRTADTPESSASTAPEKPKDKSKDSAASTVFSILKKDESEGSGFAGMFIFGFDDLGRIARHTIEHADTGVNDEGKIITAAEWLIKKAKGSGLSDGGGGLVLGCGRKTK